MSSNLEQSTNVQQGSGSTNINSVVNSTLISSNNITTTTTTEIPTNNNNNTNNEGGSGDLNTSIGSQRSLNSRIFPTSFRISRDMILNNVSHTQCQNQVRKNYLAFSMSQLHYRFFKKFGHSFKIQARLMLPLRPG